jgi:transformer-2 protein
VAPAAEPARSPLPARRTRSPSPARANGNGNGYRASSPPRGGRSPRRPAHAPAVSSTPGNGNQEGLTTAPPKAPPPSNVLGVFGLSIRTQERDLDDEFSRFGRVEKVTIVYDQRVSLVAHILTATSR